MNQITLGIIRHVLSAVGGVLAMRGYIEASDADVLAGAIVAIGGVIWSILEKKRRKQ